MYYTVLLMGIGSYLVESRPGNGHNYQAIIDAIHLYSADYPDSKASKGFEEGIIKIINTPVTFKVAQLVLNCISYELKKEKEGSNSFKLDCQRLLEELKNSIQKNYDGIKKGCVDIDKWSIDNSAFLEENYGCKFK